MLAASDPERPVPTCPGWTVQDLASHLGSVHRWAEQLVRERAQQRIPWSDRGYDRWPANPSWIVDGGTSLLAALRSTDPDIGMWSWGADQHVRFWSRRQLHETVIHRVDLELAMDREPAGSQAVAADGIDEFLVNLLSARPFSPGVGELVGEGSRLAFTEVDGNGRWLVALEEGGISLPNDHGPVDVELARSAWSCCSSSTADERSTEPMSPWWATGTCWPSGWSTPPCCRSGARGPSVTVCPFDPPGSPPEAPAGGYRPVRSRSVQPGQQQGRR